MGSCKGLGPTGFRVLSWSDDRGSMRLLDSRRVLGRAEEQWLQTTAV